MKDYKRLTDKNYKAVMGERGCVCDAEYCEYESCEKCVAQKNYERLFELEDKIESGELCEQKTCKNMTEKNPVDEFICSECGFHYEDVSETREDEDGEYSYKVEFVTKYCPNCGAKVEDEE